MTSVEKRRSSRKSGGHRKHSDGGYSDTSSGGSFLDETDREVSNLTDRAFRSLCIGDEAVYNDSDLCSSSPCSQRDRQLAFSQSGQDRDREDREREELKRVAHESFSLRVQQYGQDWIHGGMYGAEIQRDPQWEVYGERTQGRVSATFQHSFVEASQQEESLREEQLSFLSNGASELSSQQRRSRSRVSSLIRAFNSEGHRDGAGMDGETSWDKSALMSIQRELSEFSTSYQQNFNSGHFPPAGPFSSRDTNFYSSEVAHINSASSFMRSSHSKHSMSAQVNCNSNFFIHSEFSPFKVWRNHNRFPFQQGEVSGFMHCSEFPKWYETPMYKELSMEAQPQGPYRFEERGMRHPRNNLAPVVPPTPSRSTSTSMMLHKSLAVEKRCESELAGHYPHRKRTQSLGANRLPSQRPSTASPTIEMSRRVQDTISSVKALQQKIKMMTEQNIVTGMTANQQGVLSNNDNFIPFGNNANTVAPNVSSNTSSTPFNISQLHTPLVHAHQEVETSEVQQYAVSPQPVEHPPVRAESRGATPDVRMSSYKSRATSLLFNLKDNRKRVKSTYSPTKFKGLETLEKNKQPSLQEPRDTVIDIPDFPDPYIQFPQAEVSSGTNVSSYQYPNQYHNPGLALNSQPATTHTGQYSEYASHDYLTAQMQGEMVHHSGFTGFISENYASNQLANGQNLYEDSSFTPYKQGMIDHVETLGGDVYRLQPSYKATDTARLNADNNQTREYLISKANTEQHFNETVGREFTKVDRYQQLKENKHDYSNVSSQDRWRQTNSQDSENLSLKTAISPWKPEIMALKDQQAQFYQTAPAIKDELNLSRDKYRGEDQQSINKELEKTELRETFAVRTSSHKNTGMANPNISNQLTQYAPFSDEIVENPAYYALQPPGAFKDECVPQKYYGHNKENEIKVNDLTQNYNRSTDQEYRNQHSFYANKDKAMPMQETGQGKPILKGHEMQNLQPMEAKPQFEHNTQKKSLSNPDDASAPKSANWVVPQQFVEVKAEQAMADHIKAQHAQAELAKAQHWAQVEQPKVESAGLILAGQTSSEKVKAVQAKAELRQHERINQAKEEQIKDEREKVEQMEQPREKQSERAREEQTKAEQTGVQKVTEEPKNITEEAGVEHMKEVQGEQVKAEQAEVERLKEEHIKTELVKTEQAEQAQIKQAESEQARRIKAAQLEEQARADQEERARIEAEQIKAEKVKAEQAAAECSKEEQAKLEQIKDLQAKAEQEKTTMVEDDSIQVGKVNAEQHSTQISKAKEEKVDDRKAEQAKMEQPKEEIAKAELTKTDNMQERLAKPAAKLTKTQQVKSEPDRVEQVKTELAKAKAELAKIKEKMRGEQKEKVKNTIRTKEEGVKKDAPLGVECKDQDQATQMHQQREDSVGRQSSDQANRGADNYSHLREKYGFTEAPTTNGNKLPPAGNISSNNADETPVLSLGKVETTNNEKLIDKHSPTSRLAAKTENKEETDSFKSSEATESHYVYSESSKEFKLSGANYLPTSSDRENSGTASGKGKDEMTEKLEKCDPLKHTDVSQHRDFDLAKPLPLERKPKSSEHNVGPSKDAQFIPPRALSHKERAQTKQEILTSRIKAHAEKEISAIKEKGFAIRDGFISKSSIKQLTGSQYIRQRPPSQEVPKKHESSVSSNITPKHQMEPSAIQMEPVKSVSPPRSATIPVKSAASTSQLADHSQKQVPKESMKSNDNVPKPPREATQTGSYSMRAVEGLAENQKKENQSATLSKEQAPKNQPGKQEANHRDNQKEGLTDHPAVNTDHFNKKKQAPPQATTLVEAENSKPKMTEKTENKHETVHEDSAPSLNLVLSQNETPLDDDSLQITGIMVTVRERKPLVTYDQRNNSTQEKMNAKEKVCSNSEQDEMSKCHPSSGLEGSKGTESSREVSKVEPKDGVVKNTHPTVKDDQSKVSVNNHSENVQETSTQETRQNNVSENVTVKRTNLQQVSSTRPQKETQLQGPLAEKGVPSTVTVPAKNKVLAETQPLLYNQDTIARETKDYTNKTSKENSAKSTRKDEVKSDAKEKSSQKRQTAHTNDNFLGKTLNTGISYKDDSNRVQAETCMKPDAQPSMKEDMTTVLNPSKSRSTDGKNAPLLEEKTHDPTTPRSYNKTSPTNHLTENENIHVYTKLQCKETYVEENNQEDNNVHIGSIAIRVVPAVTEKSNMKMGKHHITVAPSDGVAVREHKQDASSHEEKVNTSNNNLSPAISDTQMKDSFEDELGVQEPSMKNPHPMKIGNQQNNINTTSEKTQAEKGKPEKVTKSGKSAAESKIQPMEGDYFQVQGVAETNNELHNCANVGATSEAVSKGRALPPNKAAINNESHKEGKNVFALDQRKMKTVESSSVSIQDENMKRKNMETEDNLSPKHRDSPTERQDNKNEKTEAGQTIHIRKQHTENQSSVSARERQSSRNSQPTRENTVKEAPEGKPKPKERVSTIPEISAIADYARLKVIVSEDRENTIQEFPPNKKEGFFPLIQTRHSRRPVFTADPQDLSVKQKSLPNKTEINSKANKEAKPLVFPITEKEHQRTGMFKLGDKERQEKIPLDAKPNEDTLDTGLKHIQHLKDGNKSLPTEGQSIQQPNNPDLQITTSAVKRPRNTSVSRHLKPIDSNPHEKLEISSKAERIPYFDKNSHPQPTLGQVERGKIEENKQTTPSKDNKIENALVKSGERPEKLRQERLTRHEETTAKQNTAKHLEEEQASRIKEEKNAEDMKIKNMIEESRASLAEEERRAAQREEERRAREREAIAIKIKERREKQKEAERRAEEERKAKQAEEERVAQKEEVMREKQREEERRVKETENRRKKIEEERRAKLREEERATQEEQQRRAAQEEQQRRAAPEKENQRRAAQEEQQRRAVQEEQQRRSAQMKEQQKRAAQEEQQRRAGHEEQQRRAAQEEQKRRAAQEEQERRAAQEKEQQRRAAEEEQKRRAAQEEQERRAAQEKEQQRRAAQEEQQRRAAQEEQERRAAQEKEEQRRAAQEEQQRRAAQEEQARRAAQEKEQQRRAAQEEQQRRAAQEKEQQMRAAQEEKQRRAIQEEQQRRAAQEKEQQRRAAQEEQQKRAAQEEQQKRAAHEEQQKRAAQEKEQQRRAAQEEQQRRAAQEEQRRAAQDKEQQRRAAQEEQQKRAVQEEQQRRDAQEEQQRRNAQEKEKHRRTALIEEQRQAKQIEENRLFDIEEEKKRQQRHEKAAQILEEVRITDTQEQKKAVHQTEEQRGERQKREEWMRTQREQEERRASEKVRTLIMQREEKQAKEDRTRLLEESQAALKEEEKRVAREQMLAQRDDEIRAKKREEEEKERVAQVEEQKRTVQRTDSLQYYAITSTELERKPRERLLCSPLPSQCRNNPSGLESTEDSHTRLYRPHTPASPAPSVPRSNTSSPAMGIKPSMFRVKDNTLRGSSLTKSVKPRFHKNFAEDFRVGSPMGSERGEEEQDIMRRNAVTPVYPDTGRLAAIKESSTFQPASSSQDYSVPVPYHRPYSRRSIVLDEDDSRSVISNMSEDVESFATSAADLADVRGLYDYERPESACSFSSDVSRLGKPPVVPPKSEKALRRAKRLTTRRIKKELSKAVPDSPSGTERPLQEVSSIPSSSSIEVCSSNLHAVASPHFSPPVSLTHAPAQGSSLPSSHTERQSSHSSFYASPHATGPISLPVASPHVTAPVSFPVASPHATGPASHPAAPKTVADVRSSPTLHHANHPAPVTQYHVESSYPQSYPLTQRKVLQDLGSGQYFVVDVPVPVKTKTFFDPETGKYVQLNVRESSQSTSRPQPQQTYLQPQLQPQIQAKPQQQPLSQESPAGKPHERYQGYHEYSQGYQPTAIKSVPNNRSSAPGTLHQDPQPVRESQIYGYPAPEMGQNSEGHRYSPEKTPYMDTVNDADKTYNTVYSTHGPYESFPECDTNSQVAGSSVYENDSSAHPRCQPRDIITMSELEDFMELSDW